MHGAEYLAEKGGILWAGLKIREALLHTVQAFLALDQKLPCQFIHRFEPSSQPGFCGPGAAST
jgi:hypothetical protein